MTCTSCWASYAEAIRRFGCFDDCANVWAASDEAATATNTQPEVFTTLMLPPFHTVYQSARRRRYRAAGAIRYPEVRDDCTVLGWRPSSMQVERLKITLRSAAFAGIALLPALIYCGCGDLRERVVKANPGDGAVLVDDTAVLQHYSLSSDAEWTRPPSPGLLLADGTSTWLEQPPQGTFIPNGTKAEAEDRKFLQAGKLVEPYSADSFDMQRNRAVEVVLVTIKDGPSRGLRGWMPSRFLYPTARTL